MSSPKVALIDADSIAYKYASIHQDTTVWDDGQESGNFVSSVSTDLEAALDSMWAFIEQIQERTKTESYILVVSPKKSFRSSVSEDYKKNRKSPKVPLSLLKPLKDALLLAGALLFSNVEADDVCVARLYAAPDKYVLCHIDKDLDQAVGRHFNYNTTEKYYVDQDAADYLFFYQVLMGDSVDGVKGCPKIGKVKARKILAECKGNEEMWDSVIRTYKDAGCTRDYLLEQSRLVWMLREFDEETEEFSLWKPGELALQWRW